MPNITGYFGVTAYYDQMINDERGAFYGWTKAGNNGAMVGTSSPNGWIGFSASLSSSTYQNNAPVQPNSTSAIMLVKY